MTLLEKKAKQWSVLIILLFIACTVSGQTKRIRPATEHMVFKVKMLINPATEKTMENIMIEVNNGRILKVASADNYRQEDGVTVLDLSTKYVIPGLIEPGSPKL